MDMKYDAIVVGAGPRAEALLGHIPEETYIFVGTNSIYPGMAPSGKQLVYMGMTCPADPGTDIAPYLARVLPGQGLGTHAAADSAVSVASKVERYYKIHR